MPQSLQPSNPLWPFLGGPAPAVEPFDQDAESYQKALVTRYVFPVMSGLSLLYMWAYWSNEETKLIVLVCGVLVAGLNIFMTMHKKPVRIGQFSINLRSDAVDCCRWLFNLAVMDAAFVIVLRPSLPGFVLGWLILILAAQADTFKRRHRKIVVCTGLLVGAVLLVSMYERTPLSEYLLVMFCLSAVVFIVGMTESFWLKEINRRFDMQRHEALAQLQAEALKFDAMRGSYMRTVSHELNNLLHILNFASTLDAGAIAEKQAEMIRKAVAYGLKINTLVLKEPQHAGVARACTVGELVQDLDLLLGKEVDSRGIQWQVKVEPGVEALAFRERGGSTYFIVHNLIKNAWEAFASLPAAKQTDECFIEMTAARRGTQILLRITDNAGGMPEQLRQSLLHDSATSSKQDGHGLGLRFVRKECELNGFQLDIASRDGVGSTIELTLPMYFGTHSSAQI